MKKTKTFEIEYNYFEPGTRVVSKDNKQHFYTVRKMYEPKRPFDNPTMDIVNDAGHKSWVYTKDYEEALEVQLTYKEAVQVLKPEDKVKVIYGGSGSCGCDGQIGVVVMEKSTAGATGENKGLINIKFEGFSCYPKTSIWSINRNDPNVRLVKV